MRYTKLAILLFLYHIGLSQADINLTCQFDTLSNEVVRRICYYENGDTASIRFFRNGMLNGERIFYDTLGRVLVKEYYKDDKNIGLAIMNDYEYGIFCETMYHIDGSHCTECKYANGSIMEKSCSDTTHTIYGLYRQWYSNGQLALSVYQNQGSSKYLTYHENGQSSCKGHIYYSPFARIGRWTYWDENGKKIRQERYDCKNPNVKTGTWKYYESGKLKYKERYKEDVLIWKSKAKL